MAERIVVAMSGGVDSSVAAALLQAQGYEVIGITMCFNLPDIETRKPRCCGLQGIEDARRVAHLLGIRHYVLNMQRVLEEKVIKDFCAEYSLGRTPNPCVLCNQHVKFGALLKKALSLKARYLATGHYVSTVKQGKYIFLKKARDDHKDQSYFLYRLKQFQLKHLVFPLGDFTKEQVRIMARTFELSVAEKKESQEICFLPGTDYRSFLQTRCSQGLKLGDMVDMLGKVVGRHKGIGCYTIGQREGLGIALGYPAYVVTLDRRKNAVVVGRKEDVFALGCVVKHTTCAGSRLKKKIAARVKIRYNHKEVPAVIIPGTNGWRISFKQPQFAVTPGQSVVVYQKDVVLGGGIIDEVIR